MLSTPSVITMIRGDVKAMGDFDLIELDEQDVLTAEVHGPDSGGSVDPLHIPVNWTDAHVDSFESALAQLPSDKRGVTMLKNKFSNFKRHYALLNRDSASMAKTIQYLSGKRSGGPKRDATKGLRKTAQAFFSNMSEPLLYKQAKVFGINPAMYETNEELIAALVEQHIIAHAE